MLRPFIVSLGVLLLSSSALAVPLTRPGGPRIRPQDARTAKFLELGLKRSATMRALVDRIEASNVIVYVGIDPFMKSQLAGALSFIATGANFRYVRASISGDQVPNLIIATLAHEFHHVVEVIDDASVTDDDSFGQLYRRIGIAAGDRRSSRWETKAAQATAAQVRRELGARPANTAAAS